MVVLEEYERAKKRGAPIYGEILGYGTTADAFRITDTHPEGRGAITCMKMALRDAGKNARRHRLHQRPRHEHASERPRGNARDQGSARPRRRPTRCPSPAPKA